MTVIHCHNCGSAFEIKPVDQPKPKTNGLSSIELNTVFKFMQQAGPKRATTADLYTLYVQHIRLHGGPELSTVGLGRALAANGAKPWRNATMRGWEFGQPAPKAEPAKPAPRTQTARDRAMILEGAIASNDRAAAERKAAREEELANLPFEVELPFPLGRRNT